MKELSPDFLAIEKHDSCIHHDSYYHELLFRVVFFIEGIQDPYEGIKENEKCLVGHVWEERNKEKELFIEARSLAEAFLTRNYGQLKANNNVWRIIKERAKGNERAEKALKLLIEDLIKMP